MSEWNIVGKPALIVLHMQHAICDPEGRIAHVGHARAAHESGIIPRQQALLKAFREKKLPVIFVNAITDPVKAKTAPVLGKFWSTVTGGVNMPNTKDVEVIKELPPQPGEPVIGNFPFSMFANNNLDQMLKDQGVQTLVLTGVATDMVVLASCWQASDLYYNLVVPSDASAGANQATCDAAMKMISLIAMVTPAADVVEHIKALPEQKGQAV
jgi:nicotinamidase-related amidase